MLKSPLLVSFVLVTLGACSTSDDGLRAGSSGGGKADGGECMSDAELIATARQALAAAEPDFYGDTEWRDEIASVDLTDDLNGDGVPDAIVSPGLSYSGPNVELAVFVSEQVADKDYACLTRFVGHFGATDLSATEDGMESNGLRDLTVSNVSACSADVARYVFDGSSYQWKSSESIDLCSDDPR